MRGKIWLLDAIPSYVLKAAGQRKEARKTGATILRAHDRPSRWSHLPTTNFTQRLRDSAGWRNDHRFRIYTFVIRVRHLYYYVASRIFSVALTLEDEDKSLVFAVWKLFLPLQYLHVTRWTNCGVQCVTGVTTTPADVAAACGKPLTVISFIKNASVSSPSIRPTPYIIEENLCFGYL